MEESKRPAKYRDQAEMLANRTLKRYHHLRKRFARQNIEVFRLYDWDIPEIRAVVDWYAGHLVIAEYARLQSTPEWLPMMGQALAAAFELPAENIHLKVRRAGKQDEDRYEQLDATGHRMTVFERDLRFYVNLCDYIDTGLFSDHRNTRQMIRELAEGKDFLNLYCYTGSFTCYAAKGGARSTVSVDRSETAIRWMRENMELNEIPEKGNRLVHSHAMDFLTKAGRWNQTFDLAVVDPPSYSTTRVRNQDFDILRDHPALLKAVLKVMRDGAAVFFSTNHQRFVPCFDDLKISGAREITSATIPEDYVSSKKTIHRCWKITV